MNLKLQEWANENVPSENMIYKKGYWDQIIFIRDIISLLFYNTEDDYAFIKDNLKVISQHKSKSILLPVYEIKLKNGIRFILRDNFHDWKISIDSPIDITCDFVNLFSIEEKINSIYCEGFPKELVFDSYKENKKQFTIELRNDYYVFTFFYIFSNWL